ncbi:porin [Acidisoma cellulosilytica]|uniref:Porin n=1 Tax=Acidisoma cellulosilyticum TaxID=2802395 RepID=A0A964E291_9PROT|nr:porin [Acidisoma cellulosilyticum]MCB8878598.1 porin [Acidisoma cellulosilyticum]
MRGLWLGSVATVILLAGLGRAAPALAQATPDTNLAPGQVAVHLNGRVNWYAGVEGSSLDNIGGTKTSTSSFLGYLRLYPNFQGVAPNGLHYGASAEIRTNGSASASSETLYVFQAYGYLGLPQLGQISFGQQNGPSVLTETGFFEGFNDGGWNGDIEGMIPSAANPVYPFPDSGAAYDQASDKIVYLSPALAGFQFSAGFTPNQTGSNYAPAVTTSATPIAGGMPRNMLDIGGQYTQALGPVGLQIGLDYTTAGQVANTGDPKGVTGYKDMSIFTGGATLTYGGLTVGGNAVTGAFNMADGFTFQLEPDGGSKAIGWMAGAQYALGPVVLGASFYRFTQTGDLPGGIDTGSGATITGAGLTTGQQQNNGLAAGLTYTLVPGVNLFADYLFGTRQQGGYDFATGDAGTEHNNVQSQLFGLGTQIQW